ncbi:MAG: reverse transcriptase family protein [Candidatus Thiodiazotropha sp. (ex Rostrolucina anterorostrata)]|nr:reverse transcriptase family protein [Candidatus Thiodiazotropha sp. (ex Rostrolucina anterorostrata)]
MASFKINIQRLADSLITGSWDKEALRSRLSRSLADSLPDPKRLVARLLFHFDEKSPPTRSQLISFLLVDEQILQALEEIKGKPGPRILLDPPVMGSLPDNMTTFPLPQLATWKDLQQWLSLLDHELAWFADIEGRQHKVVEPKLHHYRYNWRVKPSGSKRLIEIPKSRLKAIQRQLLNELLNRVPPHPCAHGFRRHRSCKTFVAPHVGKEVVMRMDLKDFFHSVPTPRITALFQRLGYPRGVAKLLQGLCTHAISPSLAGIPYQSLSWDKKKQLQFKHLPQGAPTSPAIANLCAWRLDCRLKGAAERFGLEYTRYADDLAFSGSAKLMHAASFLQGLVGAIVMDEGFMINHRKTRLQTRSQCQRLAGIVLNEKPNPPRKEFDLLKATLFNCIRFGPDSQNRAGHHDYKSHLAGRVAYVGWLNPSKGERLRALWERIVWPESSPHSQAR